jgi:CBS domain-containing protein
MTMRIDMLRHATTARLATVESGANLQAAAVAFANPRVELVVVRDESGAVAGVVSKSDIIRHLTLQGTGDAPVVTKMSRDVVSCRSDDDLHKTWEMMAARGLQNIPVVGDDSKPLGVLDIRDALKALFEQEEYQERLLFNYVVGVGYQ